MQVNEIYFQSVNADEFCLMSTRMEQINVENVPIWREEFANLMYILFVSKWIIFSYWEYVHSFVK